MTFTTQTLIDRIVDEKVGKQDSRWSHMDSPASIRNSVFQEASCYREQRFSNRANDDNSNPRDRQNFFHRITNRATQNDTRLTTESPAHQYLDYCQSSPMNLSTTTSKREIDNLGDMNVEEAPHQNERPSSHWKKIIVSKEKRLKDIKDKQFWDPKWNSVRFEIFITVLSSLKTLPISPSHRLPHLQHNPTLPCLAEFRLRFYNMWN